ncbi:hypothetical protein D9615_005404 [Tricholomella constricta]|uniref:DNA 3'-5' helicase n=1 Tax=Tricholomella constricta TaxID=117010 RepID=A0A8H5M5N5_9AGAR|nr:hypothetical protein D9615_005404 [Tricholomella constricta]
MEKLGISAANITGETATDGIFKEIEAGDYRVVIVSPEKILKDKRFRDLWQSKKFTARLFNITFDEAHCISEWGNDFRPEYAQLGQLRWLVPAHVPFHIVSATLPELILKDVQAKLNIKADNTTIIHRSNDRPNIHFMVEEMQSPANSWLDLDRILRLHANSGENPPKFMVFVNKRREAEDGVEHEWKSLPQHLREKVVWFHSGMSAEFRAKMIQKIRVGEIWGILCTDAAGMGLDISDIELVIQWRYTPSLCTVTQRFGRGARQGDKEATGIYLVEPKYFDHCKKKVSGIQKRKRGRTAKERKLRRKVRDNEQCLEQDSDEFVSDSDASDGEGSGNALATPVGGVNQASDVAMEIGHDSGLPQSIHDAAPGAPQKVPHPLKTGLLPSPYSMSPEEYEATAMDTFINARLRGICRRTVTDHYFGNHKLGSFVLVSLNHPAVKATRGKRKVKADKYTMKPHDHGLKDALDAWRTKQLATDFEGDDFFGPQMILSDDLLDRIVDLAHYCKIPDVEALLHQTSWRYASKYGPAIQELVFKYQPEPPLAPTPALIPPTTESASQAVPVTCSPLSLPTKKARLCSACGSFTHIASNKVCPNYRPAMRRQINDENVDPASTSTPSQPLASKSKQQRQCRACGEMGHIASSKKCPAWKPKEDRVKLDRRSLSSLHPGCSASSTDAPPVPTL